MSASLSILGSLLAPETPENFFRECWNRHAAYIEGSPAKLEGFFDRAAFEQALSQCEVLKATYKDPRGWTTEVPIQASQARNMFEAGMTICAGHVRGNAVLDRFLTGFRRELLLPGNVYFNCYYSPDGKGFGLHLDDHPVFILQIEGSKHWWYSQEPGVPNPPRGFSFPPGLEELNVPWGRYKRPDESAFRDVVLKPGDVLYLPPGCWHRAEAIGKSLALTLAIFGASPLEVLRSALAARFARVPEIQRAMPGLWSGDARVDSVPEDLRATFELTLATTRMFLNNLTAEDLYETWRATALEQG